MQFLKGIQGTAKPGPGQPPQDLFAFYWHFVKQAKGWYIATFVASLFVALLDTVIPLFIGRLVSLMEATDRMAALEREWPVLIGMIVLVLLVRTAGFLIDMAIRWVVLSAGRDTQMHLRNPMDADPADRP